MSSTFNAAGVGGAGNRWCRLLPITSANYNNDQTNSSRLKKIHVRPTAAGKIYLPDCSYREMTEWALPVKAQA